MVPGATTFIRLSPAQDAHLVGAAYLPADLREIADSARRATASSSVCLAIDLETADRFQSAFTERLAQVGFDSDYDVTEEGAVLEGLIDAFSCDPQ